ncbi:MAG TPA: hypothetical protein VE641_05250 [Chthoniobacterales bacterium]|nr:hypothetical protein [Chthoniobacterales bacterium]
MSGKTENYAEAIAKGSPIGQGAMIQIDGSCMDANIPEQDQKGATLFAKGGDGGVSPLDTQSYFRQVQRTQWRQHYSLGRDIGGPWLPMSMNILEDLPRQGPLMSQS